MNKVLTEGQVRAYFKCPAFYTFNGQVEAKPLLEIVKGAFEAITYTALSERPLMKSELPTFIGRELKKRGLHKTLPDGDLMQLSRQATILLDRLWRPMLRQKAVPVFPARTVRTRLSRTAIDVSFSAIYRDVQGRGNRYLIYLFSPYRYRLDLLNDPVLYLQVETLQAFLREALGDVPVLFQVVGVSPAADLLLETVRPDNFKPMHKTRLQSGLRSLEAGRSFPVTPCPDRSCSKQSTCIPLENR